LGKFVTSSPHEKEKKKRENEKRKKGMKREPEEMRMRQGIQLSLHTKGSRRNAMGKYSSQIAV